MEIFNIYFRIEFSEGTNNSLATLLIYTRLPFRNEYPQAEMRRWTDVVSNNSISQQLSQTISANPVFQL